MAELPREALPTNVKPTHYDLTLRTDLDKYVFEGRVGIRLLVHEPTTSISLNAKEIDVVKATLNAGSKSHELSKSPAKKEENEVVTLNLPEGVTIDPSNVKEATLDLVFTGAMTDDLSGLYRSPYTDNDGKKQYLVSTQFEPASARKSFPCFDEPALKATFSITLIVPENLVALSNSPVVSEKPYDKGSIVDGTPFDGTKYKEVTFKKTTIMSTYLVAFVVGPLKYVESATHSHQPEIPVRVYALPGLEQQGKFSLDVATKALDYFSEIFEIPYPLDKMDMVAIPDFQAGAMENWGLVTYRHEALLFDDERSADSAKQEIAYTVCHELAHQWFGNLVTMKWWDDLWLNEGFATWVGWLAVNKIFPEWDIWTDFVSSEWARGLQLDALRSSHPIQVHVSTPEEVDQIFDAISYSKGASVIRMLASWLGEKVFLKGISKYLKIFAYSNASTADLWSSLNTETGQDVSSFMENWTKEVGFPVINVDQGSSSEIQIRQQRYLSTGDVKESEDTTIWWIPLNVKSPNSDLSKHAASFTLTSKSDMFIVTDPIFKLNEGQAGVYRVNYGPELLKPLALELEKGSDGILAHPSDRIGLLQDTSALALSGYQRTSGFLELLEHLNEETEYLVWKDIHNRLVPIFASWADQPQDIQKGLRKLGVKLFSKVADRLGWECQENEGVLTGLLRATAIDAAGNNGYTPVVKEAIARFQKTQQGDDKAIHPNLRRAVYSIVLSQGDDALKHEAYDYIFKLYTDAQLPIDHRMIALECLILVDDEALVRKTLNMGLDAELVQSQDILTVYRNLRLNAKYQHLYFPFLQENFDYFQNRFGKIPIYLGYIVAFAAISQTTEAGLQRFREFLADKDTKAYQRTVDQQLEQAGISCRRVERDAKDVEEWLRSRNYV
ncbi:hypothetical protein BZG36_00345 [Bifiguratus adelaidae]|uniref:Aminopeptidase n=1 Tax=Bifiguratus adelaidae TaxID=1938954 RepID=A0A261Y824_9FUNG|nr:hypothetical protein BZG36_00345 [Bifiguratus adelaidae]